MSLHSLFSTPCVHSIFRRKLDAGKTQAVRAHVGRISDPVDEDEKARMRLMKSTSKREQKPMLKPHFSERVRR
jgi:hypothetical protein